MDAIRTTKLTKRYGSARGVTDLDLRVEAGEFFGFIGPNGAGKSTTIRTLLGLLRPSSGGGELLGRDITGDRRTLLASVGYMPSETAFWPGMRVRDVLRFSAGLRRRDCAARTEELCARLRLDPGQRVDTLSLGNRKKVSIVCALQHDPELLILDEPTSGLDPLMQREFFNILEERNRAGATVFLSSHVLAEIQRHCGRAALIREGRLVACGDVAALAGTGARRVVLRGTANLEGLPGLRDLRQTEEGMSFLFGGEMEALLGRLAAGRVWDLTVTEPDLEEIFLHWYEEERI